MAKCFILPKTLLFALLASALLLNTGCPPIKDNKDDPAGNTDPSDYKKQIKEVKVKDRGTYIFKKNSSGVVDEIETDGGEVYQITHVDGNVAEIAIPGGSAYFCTYNNDDQITQTIYDQVSYKLKTDYTYQNGYVNEIQIYTLLRQSDGSFSVEKSSEILNIVNNDKGVSSFVFNTYNAGALFNSYDAVVTCSAQENNLIYNQPYCILNDFTDRFYSVTSCVSTRCITQIDLTNKADSTKIGYNCSYQYDAQGRIIQKTVASSQAGLPDIVHNIGYY